MKEKMLHFECIDDEMAEVLRAKTGVERLEIIDRLYLFARQLTESNVRAQHPEWDNQRVRKAVAERIAGGSY